MSIAVILLCSYKGNGKVIAILFANGEWVSEVRRLFLDLRSCIKRYLSASVVFLGGLRYDITSLGLYTKNERKGSLMINWKTEQV